MAAARWCGSSRPVGSLLSELSKPVRVSCFRQWQSSMLHRWDNSIGCSRRCSLAPRSMCEGREGRAGCAMRTPVGTSRVPAQLPGPPIAAEHERESPGGCRDRSRAGIRWLGARGWFVSAMNFAELAEAEQRSLLRRLRRMVGSPELAEDLCQEALVRAWRAAPRDATVVQLRAWLHRVASNLAIDELRRAGRRPMTRPLDDFVLAGREECPDEVLAAREALSRLGPHERLVLLLRFEVGFSYPEIARLLETSPAAARQRLARARRAFSAALDGVSPAGAARQPKMASRGRSVADVSFDKRSQGCNTLEDGRALLAARLA